MTARNRTLAWLVPASALMLGGCLSVSVETPGNPLPPKALQIRTETRQFAAEMSDEVQRAADAIALESTDPAIRSAALKWKLGTSVATRHSAYRAVPIHALADTWAFATQARAFFEEGAGARAFGDRQSRAREVTARLAKDARALAERLLEPAQFERLGGLVREQAQQEPLLDLEFVRAPLPLSAVLEGAAAPTTVGSAPEVVADVADRLDVYGRSIPDEARWRAELYVQGTGVKAADIAKLLARTEETLRQVYELAETQPAKAAKLLDEVRGDLQKAWSQVDRRWVETLATLQAERAALARTLETMQGNLDATIGRERAAFDKAFARERAALSADAERISFRVAGEARSVVREAVAWFYGTIMLVLGATFVIGFLLGRAMQRRRESSAGAGSSDLK